MEILRRRRSRMMMMIIIIYNVQHRDQERSHTRYLPMCERKICVLLTKHPSSK